MQWAQDPVAVHIPFLSISFLNISISVQPHSESIQTLSAIDMSIFRLCQRKSLQKPFGGCQVFSFAASCAPRQDQLLAELGEVKSLIVRRDTDMEAHCQSTSPTERMRQHETCAHMRTYSMYNAGGLWRQVIVSGPVLKWESARAQTYS